MMAQNDVSLYPYHPSKAAAIFSTIIFAILLAIHTFKLFKTRTWFATPFVIGAIFETLGYLSRFQSASHPTSLNPYIAQTLLILLAPILFAASIYMFLGRIIRSTGLAPLSIIRPTWLTKIFVGGDILCFLVQAAGASMLAKADASTATKNLGKEVVLAGLVIQLFVFGFFVLVGAIFHLKARKVDNKGSTAAGIDWQKYLFMLYGVSGLITIRNLFRVAEYVMGPDGYLLHHEWPIYVFDAFLMAVALAVCATWYVGDIVSKNKHGDGENVYIMMAGQGGVQDRV